jgi:hypothetical protein
MMFVGLVLGGCSVMGSLRLGGITHGLLAGSDVGIFVH